MSGDSLSKLPGNAVTVRGLSPELKARLRVRAAHNARSMEAEARAILEAELSAPDDESTDLGAFARSLFAPLGGVNLEVPTRALPRQPPLIGELEPAPTEVAESPVTVIPVDPEPAIEASAEAVTVTTRKRRR